MAQFILRRLASAIAMLLAVSLLTFFVFYVFPSADPALLRAGRHPTPQLVEQVRTTLGLDRSVAYQYGHFLNRLVFHADLGRSFYTGVSVRDEVFARLPVSAYLALGGAVIWLLVGISAGVVSAMRPGSFADRASMGFTLVAISAPPYWLGLVLLYLLSRDGRVLRLFPGQGSCLDFRPAACAPAFVLPWVALAMAFTAFYARLTRSSLLETLGEDYLRTARAKGMSERRLVFRHGLRPALTPLLSVFGLDLALLLGGALLIETVFNLPGLGRYALEAIQEGDLPAVQGTVLFSAGFIVVANAAVDVVYGLIDPRISDR